MLVRQSLALSGNIVADMVRIPRPTGEISRPITTRGRRVLAIADQATVTVIDLETGEILSTHLIDPTKHYWRNTQRAPGRWPGAQ